MIILLSLILFLNLIYAHKIFKDWIAPPLLLGYGMFAASLIATLYYNEWQMSSMLFMSVLILGGGPLLFTIICNFFNKQGSHSFVKYNIDISKLKNPLIVLNLLAVINIVLKIKLYQNAFGSFLNFSELIFAARMDGWSGENTFRFPQIVIWITAISTYFSYISAWLLAYCFITKQKENRIIKQLTLIHLFIVSFDGLLYGAKGSMIDPWVRLCIIYILMRGTLPISKKILTRIIFVAVLFILSFKSLTALLGRDVEGKNNFDMFAVYCGAQIKNFDMYMHGEKIYQKSKLWGSNTFNSFYIERNLKEADIGAFQTIGKYSLGNVYTQYASFHLDFGTLGVVMITILMAIISMFFYKKALLDTKKINIFLLLYSELGYCLLMSFFSSNFTNFIFRVGYLKAVFYICLFTFLTNKYLIKIKS